MSGWAATNTLRERLEQAPWQCSGCNGSRSALCGDCETASRDRDAAALALVETALDAAAKHLEHTRGFCVDKDAEADLTCPSHRALAAALRAVREGA